MNKESPRLRSGLVFGKFMPMHEGHVHLFNFARNSVDRLTILVGTLPTEPIPGKIRFEWVKRQFPDVNVVHQDEVLPQDPSEHPDFWNVWKNSIERHCPNEKFDVLFGSENYGWKMAEVLGIEYIPVNRVRDLVPISGTEMRKEPMKNWDYLPVVVRPYFGKKVAVVGPSSAGKTLLTKTLAEYYNTVFVSNYAESLQQEYTAHRGYKEGEILYEDINTIARGQMATEDSLFYRANRVMFCDTELLTTVNRAMSLFNKCPDWIVKESQLRKYDLYIVAEPTQGGQGMPVVWWEDYLNKAGAKYIKVGNDWNNRLAMSLKAVDELIEARKYKPIKFAVLATDIAVFTYHENKLKVLLVNVDSPPHYHNVAGLLGGTITLTESAEDSIVRHLKERGGMDSGDIYIEQLHTFSDPDRDPRGRAVSTAFIGLTNVTKYSESGKVFWQAVDDIPSLAYDHDAILSAAVAKLKLMVEREDLLSRLLPKNAPLQELEGLYEQIRNLKYIKSV